MIVPDSEYVDFSKVPQSRGIGKEAFVALAVGLIGIFAMGFLSCFLSGYGHLWPAQKTLRTDLGSMPSISSSQSTNP
ncbi:MAG: hypothetical protein JO322_15980 [Candidatus Eremiobacteraeota bacterium]|nr:hypothetical protein [Candidatus Eremiobacteraeota bacterium]